VSLGEGGKQASVVELPVQSVTVPVQGVVGVQIVCESVEQVKVFETPFSLVKVNVTGPETAIVFESPTVALMVVIGRGPPFIVAGVDFRGMSTLNCWVPCPTAARAEQKRATKQITETERRVNNTMSPPRPCLLQ